jgi:RND family efflux transporter MFP subunit
MMIDKRSTMRHAWTPIMLGLSPVFLFLTVQGCSPADKSAPTTDAAISGTKIVTVTVDKPKREILRRDVAQPGYMRAFEQTAIYPKIAGYVLGWHVDIGDHVKEGQILAELYVPEMVKELKQKEEIVNQARKAFDVAKGRAAAAGAFVDEVSAGLQRARANHERWRSEYDRLAKLAGTIIDAQTKDETWNQFQSAKAGEEEAKAKIVTARATWDEAKAAQTKASADIAVAQADHDRMAALVAYARLSAPFAGVVIRRNINTGDFVQPPTAGKGEPLYVVERQDTMRVFVTVPETEAAWVRKGLKAKVVVQALQGQQFGGEVARTSASLDPATRTLLAEIDLPNAQDRLRPGMYAYATISAQQEGFTLPSAAVVTQGDVTQGYQSFCFVEKDGKARRLAVELGMRQGSRVQILRKQLRAASASELAVWESFSGEERVIQENATSLTDGQSVRIH